MKENLRLTPSHLPVVLHWVVNPVEGPALVCPLQENLLGVHYGEDLREKNYVMRIIAVTTLTFSWPFSRGIRSRILTTTLMFSSAAMVGLILNLDELLLLII